MSKLARDNRNADLARIHIARQQLGMPDADYRTMIIAVGGAATGSARDLDFAGRLRVLEHLRRLGFRPTAAKNTRRPKRPTPSADALPLVRRIRAQLISLDNKPDEYADGIAKQMLGADAPEYFEWCHVRDLYKISQALGAEQGRKGARTR